jgi:hypothetical protein
MPKTDLTAAPRFLRTKIVRGLAAGEGSPVERDGGDFGAGLIRGFAVITRGEARGHDVWIDETFLRQVAEKLAAGDGVRSRFTHPGLSSDGLATKLGRAKAAGVEGDIVRGDLHFSRTSHKTPEGDLGGYVMDLAEEDPEQFGASIVFEYDSQAERDFYRSHLDGESGRFQSPDPQNVKNLPHARLSELRAVDIVDEPAANPSGMFHVSEIPAEADALCAYALGLSDERPELFELAGIHPDRLRAFAGRFLQTRGLTVAAKGDNVPQLSSDPANPPADAPKPDAAPPVEPKPDEKPKPEGDGKPADEKPAETPEEKLGRYIDTFGAADGATYFREKLTFEEALSKSHAKLSAENKRIGEKLNAALAAAGEATPVDSTPAATTPAAAPAGKFSGLTPGLSSYAASLKLPGR